MRSNARHKMSPVARVAVINLVNYSRIIIDLKRSRDIIAAYGHRGLGIIARP